MKLKVFNNLAIKGKPVKAGPMLSINTTTDVVLFNKPLVELAGLKDRVIIFQDEDSPADWFLAATSNDDGIPLRIKEKNVLIQSAVIAHEIRKTLKLQEGHIFHLKVSATPQQANGHNIYTIITASAQAAQFRNRKAKEEVQP